MAAATTTPIIAAAVNPAPAATAARTHCMYIASVCYSSIVSTFGVPLV
jgi:hypothetical protein